MQCDPELARSAHIESQCLLDSIHNAISRMDDQRLLLISAIKEVQKTNIEVRSEQELGARYYEEPYVQEIFKAWEANHTTFRAIFFEMRGGTAALSNRATETDTEWLRRALQGIRKAKAEASTQSNHQTGSAPPNDNSTATDPSRRPALSLKRRLDETTEAKAHSYASKARHTTIDDEPESPTVAALRASRVLQKGLRLEEAFKKHCTEMEELKLNDDGRSQHKPVQYEDVTAEAEHRMRQREQQRKEVRGDSKRKRQSQDLSVVDLTQDSLRPTERKRVKKEGFIVLDRSSFEAGHQKTNLKRKASCLDMHDQRAKLRKREYSQ